MEWLDYFANGKKYQSLFLVWVEMRILILKVDLEFIKSLLVLLIIEEMIRIFLRNIYWSVVNNQLANYQQRKDFSNSFTVFINQCWPKALEQRRIDLHLCLCVNTKLDARGRLVRDALLLDRASDELCQRAKQSGAKRAYRFQATVKI